MKKGGSMDAVFLLTFWHGLILLVLHALLPSVVGGQSTTAVTAANPRRDRPRPIQIRNDARSRIQVYWIDPETNERVRMSKREGILPGTEYFLDSVAGHEFLIKEIPGRNGTCRAATTATAPMKGNHPPLSSGNASAILPSNSTNVDDDDLMCGSALFRATDGEDQVVQVTASFEAVVTDRTLKAQHRADQLLGACPDPPTVSATAWEEWKECVRARLSQALETLDEELGFQARIRTELSDQLENHTCADDSLNSTKDVRRERWKHMGTSYRVRIKHERPASSIHIVEGFASSDECALVESLTSHRLRRATVADGKGGAYVSDYRRAQRAGIKVDWSKEAEGDLVALLSRRIYNYTNHVLGLDIREHGQEDLVSIQYEGRGADDPDPDRFLPHCDGDCTGLPHAIGQRVATLIVFCTVPDPESGGRGGHTNFGNAGVHIRPSVGDALFFSYINPTTRMMDDGYSQHSGCPVVSGHKKIVTQFVRLGVDTNNPWNSFNTLGIKRSEAKEYELDDLERSAAAIDVGADPWEEWDDGGKDCDDAWDTDSNDDGDDEDLLLGEEL